MKINYPASGRKLENGYEVIVNNTGIFWGVFHNGQKVTEFMNCHGSDARALVTEFLAARGIEY